MSPGEVPAQRGLCGSQRGVWRVGPGVPQSMVGGSPLVIMWGETGGGGLSWGGVSAGHSLVGDLGGLVPIAYTCTL